MTSHRDGPGASIAFAEAVEQEREATVVELTGQLTSTNAPAVRQRLAALLEAHECVLLDVNRLELEHPSTLQVLPSAMTEAGGWPDARLAVFTADPMMRHAMQAAGVARLLWVAHDAQLARARCPVRPLEVRAEWSVLPAIDAPARLRRNARRRCGQWGLGEEATQDALLVVTELASNAVDHANSSMRVHLGYDGSTLRVWVRDHSLDPPRLRPEDAYAPRGRGLQMVDALASQWGWRTHDDGKTVWAVLEPTR